MVLLNGSQRGISTHHIPNLCFDHAFDKFQHLRKAPRSLSPILHDVRCSSSLSRPSCISQLTIPTIGSIEIERHLTVFAEAVTPESQVITML